MFGMPFHALTIHLPETLRIVNGRSIVAEAAERLLQTKVYIIIYIDLVFGEMS